MPAMAATSPNSEFAANVLTDSQREGQTQKHQADSDRPSPSRTLKVGRSSLALPRSNPAPCGFEFPGAAAAQ
jgi:hypothetical protein